MEKKQKTEKIVMSDKEIDKRKQLENEEKSEQNIHTESVGEENSDVSVAEVDNSKKKLK